MNSPQKIGILHPGQMGISVAASAQKSGHTLFWVSQKRSQKTQERAQKFKLENTQTLEQLCRTCSIILSVCPPDAAEEVAAQVAFYHFEGIYVDANAIAPQKAKKIEKIITKNKKASFVDGGIIGGPAWEPNQTWLYLSGNQAQTVADCFSKGPLQVEIVEGGVGQASALKMCFAAYTKGSTALLCSIVATAESLGVRANLEKQWSRNGSDFTEKTLTQIQRVTAKAWRFAGEMEEISQTFDKAGLPKEFHQGAAEIYRRLANFKNTEKTPPLEIVLEAMLKK